MLSLCSTLNASGVRSLLLAMRGCIARAEGKHQHAETMWQQDKCINVGCQPKCQYVSMRTFKTSMTSATHSSFG